MRRVQESAEVRKVNWISWNWSNRQLWVSKGVLGTNPGSFAKAVNCVKPTPLPLMAFQTHFIVVGPLFFSDLFVFCLSTPLSTLTPLCAFAVPHRFLKAFSLKIISLPVFWTTNYPLLCNYTRMKISREAHERELVGSSFWAGITSYTLSFQSLLCRFHQFSLWLIRMPLCLWLTFSECWDYTELFWVLYASERLLS